MDRLLSLVNTVVGLVIAFDKAEELWRRASKWRHVRRLERERQAARYLEFCRLHHLDEQCNADPELQAFRRAQDVL